MRKTLGAHAMMSHSLQGLTKLNWQNSEAVGVWLSPLHDLPTSTTFARWAFIYNIPSPMGSGPRE